MAVRSKLFPSDEELGKRDDDHHHKISTSSSWIPRGKKPIIRPKRVLGLLVACFLTWLFVRNIPNDMGPAEGRLTPWNRNRPVLDPDDPRRYTEPREASKVPEPPQGAPPEAAIKEEDADIPPQNFEGPIRFFYLASSLHGIIRTNGQRPENRNILFAASDLKSAADIIPLACEMAGWKRNFVHMVLMGRDKIPLEEVMKINGVDSDSCDVYWHDGRPDYAQYSTDARMEVSVAGALGHIHGFMHPQAVITANALNEDDFFARGMARKTKELHRTHIELPTNKQLANMGWLTRLEAQALRMWHAATVDVLIQAPQDASGSLVRLLMSLERADYGSFVPPRLTIELPHRLNDDTMIFLDNFRWPPQKYQEDVPINQLALRRRIPDKHLSADEASTRFIESFYPSHTQNSHVLILSPQVELSPAYYHYLKYNLLEYKYSSYNSSDLFGISLETPSTKLDGAEEFEPPLPVRSSGDDDHDPPITPFLWQAPNSNAALYFADKWIEFHSYLTKYNQASRHPSTKKHIRDRKKLVSKQLPAWTEALLDLMRTRGYRLLYPNSQPGSAAGNAVAITHKELFQVPEEWILARLAASPEVEETPSESSTAVLGAPVDYLGGHGPSSDSNDLKVSRNLLKSLLQVLPVAPPFARKPRGDDDRETRKTPPPSPALRMSQMPLLDYNGNGVTEDDLELRASNRAIKYRLTSGGCENDEAQEKEVLLGNADDLFCIDDDFEPEDEEESSASPIPAEKEAAELKHKGVATDEARGPATSKPTKASTTQQYAGEGAASTVDAVVNAARYEETARAGLKAKTGGKSKVNEDDEPNVGIAEKDLTDMQRADLQKWKAKQRKETGEVPDAPKPRGTYTRAVTDEVAKATSTVGGNQEPDDLVGKPVSDPDDRRPPDQRPRNVKGTTTSTTTAPAGARPAPTDADPVAPPPAPATSIDSSPSRTTNSDDDKTKDKTTQSFDVQDPPNLGSGGINTKDDRPRKTPGKNHEDDLSHESQTRYNPPSVDAAAYGAAVHGVEDLEEVPRGERVRASQKLEAGETAESTEKMKTPVQDEDTESRDLPRRDPKQTRLQNPREDSVDGTAGDERFAGKTTAKTKPKAAPNTKPEAEADEPSSESTSEKQQYASQVNDALRNMDVEKAKAQERLKEALARTKERAGERERDRGGEREPVREGAAPKRGGVEEVEEDDPVAVQKLRERMRKLEMDETGAVG